MEVVCPKCGFMGNIDDALIPESGRNVTCKRCKANFFITKDDLDTSGDRGYENPPDIDAAFAKLKTTNRDSSKSKYNIEKILTFTLLFLITFGLGYLSGYLTGDFWITETTTIGTKNDVVKSGETPVTSNIDEAGPKDLPSPISPEVSGTSPPTDTLEGESHESDTTTNPLGSTSSIELPDSSESIESWELYKSDIYVDIDEIDEKIQSLYESDFTKIQKEWELKEYGEGLLGNNLSGKLSVIDVRGAVYYNEDATGAGDNFPDKTYRYVIEAENIGEGYPKCKIYIGLKDEENLVSAIKKGSKIYIEGIIYSYDVAGEIYRLNIINPRVDIIF